MIWLFYAYVLALMLYHKSPQTEVFTNSTIEKWASAVISSSIYVTDKSDFARGLGFLTLFQTSRELSMNKTDLQALTKVVPTRPDPLAVLHLDNRLYISFQLQVLCPEQIPTRMLPDGWIPSTIY